MIPIRHRGRRLATEIYDGAFKMLVDTTLAGSASDTFILPTTGSLWRAEVSWGDGISQYVSGAAGSVSHTYALPGQYVVSIRERFTGGSFGISFNNGGDRLKVLKILQWGTVAWTSMVSAFFGCANMVITATDAHRANTRGVTSIATMFRGCTALTNFQPFDTSNVTSMSGLFNSCSALTAFPFRQTRACTVFTQFCYATGLTAFPWIDTSAGQSFNSAWYNCTGLNTFDFPELDLHNITDGANMMFSVAISKASYNNMLDQLANGRGSIPAAAATGIAFRTAAHYDASTGGYDGTAARAYLEGTKTWSIIDGGTP